MIERLRAEGWAVTGIARSEETRAGVTTAGALALSADVTDAASVFAALEQAADAHGGVDLVLNAASAYGGDRSGPFGGGPLADAAPDAFDAWAAAPARAAFTFLSGHLTVPARARDTGDDHPGDRRLVPSRCSRTRVMGGRCVRRARIDAGSGSGVA